jgi:hypothetical protein
MSAADGATIDRRIHISRPDEGRGRCKDSRARDPRKDFPQWMQPSTTPCMGLFPSSLSFLYSLLLPEAISQSAAVETIRGERAIGRVSTRRNLVCGGPSKGPNRHLQGVHRSWQSAKVQSGVFAPAPRSWSYGCHERSWCGSGTTGTKHRPSERPGSARQSEDTTKLLEEPLGETVADRFVDFCKLSAGLLGLRVSSLITAHALREMGSILRETLEDFAGVSQEPSGAELAEQNEAAEALRKLGHDEDAIARCVSRLQPQDSHKAAIKKIVAWLGLVEDSDIAKSWLAIIRADEKAHERKFNRNLRVDNDFREQWAQPFDTVIRGVAAALQTRYAAPIVRAGRLARKQETAAALSAFEKQSVGAITVQCHFYRSIEGPAWLPGLISRGLVAEPLPARRTKNAASRTANGR